MECLSTLLKNNLRNVFFESSLFGRHKGPNEVPLPNFQKKAYKFITNHNQMNKTMKAFKFLLIAVLAFSLSNCAVVRQGEVGVKRTLGKYDDKTISEGVKAFNPFITTIVKVPVQTENLEVALNLPFSSA